MQKPRVYAYEVVINVAGDTVWVNDMASSIGRFSKKFGIDVHERLDKIMDGAPVCLMCTHAPAGAKEWQTFREAMHKYHGVWLKPDLIAFP